MAQILSIQTLNDASPEEAALTILPFIERSPLVASYVADRLRPFADIEELKTALASAIHSLEEGPFLALACGHPVLSPPAPEEMTPESQSEQARLGLASFSPGLRERLDELNRIYIARFGFPLILALHRIGSTAEMFETFTFRLENSREVEIENARNEIASVAAARVNKAFT